MRALRISALLLAFCLAACGHHAVTAKPTTTSTRPLVAVPGPAELPQYPVPELKPSTDVVNVPASTDAGAGAGTPPAGATNSQTAAPAAPSTTEGATSSAPTAPAAQGTTAGAASTAPTVPAAPSTAAAPSAPTTVPAVEYDPDRLVGLSEGDAMKLLGPPAEQSDSPPSRVWTYRSQTCDVKLFFYPEVGGTTYRTLTYEINDRDPADTTHGGCVGGLVKAHAG